MKHLNIEPLIEAVKNIELQQVKNLLQSDKVKTISPINPVSVEFYGGNGPASALVKSVSLNEKEEVVVEVWDEYFGGSFDITPEDIYPGQLLGIFDSLSA